MTPNDRHMTSIDRRRFLEYVWYGVGATTLASLLPAESASADQPRFTKNPFTLGVASGDPTSSGIVLWTRLAPEPTDPTFLGSQTYSVGWRIATDDQMRRVVARGKARAMAELAHSVHVEVDELRAGADYFYQFDVAGEESRIGHFRTAPRSRETAQSLKFAVATCQDWPSGYYTAYRDMVANDLDLVLHLGDYTYEYPINSARRAELPAVPFRAETVDLRTYRLRHTLYKMDPDLQAAHAKFPFAVIWDDHEVANDYSGLAPEYDVPSPAFTARRAAAYQAFYEHMPIRSAFKGLSDRGRGEGSDDSEGRDSERENQGNSNSGELKIYRRLKYGQLAEITMLDDRQYRTDNPYGDGESSHNGPPKFADYTMLGAEQERWVAKGLSNSKSRWNIFGQGLLIAELEHATIEPGWYWNDAWDGYPAARTRLLNDVVRSGATNPVFFSGDWHSTFANELKVDFRNRASAPIATEFVTPAITTGGDATPYGPYYAPMVPFNPHIKYYEGDKRGYMKVTVTSEQMRVDVRFVTSVENQGGTGYTERTFFVENGRPGPQG